MRKKYVFDLGSSKALSNELEAFKNAHPSNQPDSE